MDWLNYHHLYYFWTVAHEGSIAKASVKLKLSQPTLSSQIHQLEENIGKLLFKRQGRGLVLTEIGRFTLNYADEIFKIGHDLMDSLADRGTGGLLRMQVGIADVVPKLVAHHILDSVLEYKSPVSLVCHEDKPENLVLSLAAHRLDLVIAESPQTNQARIKVFSHLLGESATSVFGVKKYWGLRRKFPESLKGQPMLLPSSDTVMRRQIDSWLDQRQIKPIIIGEFDDSGLLKTFGQRGVGLFFAPKVISPDLKKHYGVEIIGDAAGLKESYYAITVERKIKHPLVSHILHQARSGLFKE